jgi:hydroxymethylglutaryl-CoA lyase
MSKLINIIEVGLRDGLQTEKRIFTSHEKFILINNLIRAGIRNIEVTSFVKNIPQFEDNKHIAKNILKYNEVNYSALVPTVKGYNDMLECENIKEIVLFVSTSETFNKKNINATKLEAFERFKNIARLAHRDGIKIRGSISCCFGCPYEGEIRVEDVIDIIKRYNDIGVHKIDIADTIGTGTTRKIITLLDEVLKECNINKLTGHFHDTNNSAIELVKESLNYGITTFHSSIGGLGGCPFSSKVVGNLSTEKLIDYLHRNNYKTGIDLNKIRNIKV